MKRTEINPYIFEMMTDFIFQILDSHLTDKVQDLFHNESTEH